ncbi:type III secretion system cytoplasmic ring protein SctQ [Stenotrophomonas sp. NPDC077659]|uniref:type III secretion system cytoplasmic ring protein SctQ n=1 Tax=Stenotrophomonas sp. NPDC077659 TaxID=3390694 RepID=UPI003D0500DB
MSAAFPLLKQIGPAPLRLQQLHQWLRQQRVDVQLRPLPGVPCLRFELHGASGTLTCQVQAQDWAAHHLPALQGLDWMQMDHDLLCGLCSGAMPLPWDIPALECHDARFLGIATATADAPVHPQVQSRLGPVWIEQMDGTWPQHAAAIEVTGHERLPLALRLGRIACPPRRLRRLRPGDILLLPGAHPQAWRANRCLFDFTLQPDVLLVTTIHPTEADQPDDSSVAAHATPYPALDLASLPLSLEVVLGTLQMSLAELAELCEGSTLHLPAQAHRHVRIEHNGHCVATGELVQVGTTLGVQLAQAPHLK